MDVLLLCRVETCFAVRGKPGNVMPGEAWQAVARGETGTQSVLQTLHEKPDTKSDYLVYILVPVVFDTGKLLL
jgi:hypothetical protein